MIRFERKAYAELSLDELSAAFRLRQEIFVVEQHCPYVDIDGLDPKAWHDFAWADEKDRAVLASYCRILPEGAAYEDAAAIGRIVTDARYRGRGLAAKLIERSLAFIRADALSRLVRMSAQTHLAGYYGRFGFERFGDEYLEDGIPHIGVMLRLT